jgi:hypothetical protein
MTERRSLTDGLHPTRPSTSSVNPQLERDFVHGPKASEKPSVTPATSSPFSRERQFLLPACSFQVIRFHERQAVAVEHETDVDEEDAIAGAAVEKFLFEQFPHAALIRAVADAVILGDVLIELDFIAAGVGPHFVIHQLEDLKAGLGQARRLLDAIQKQLDEAAAVHFLFPPEAHAADFDLAAAVVHDDGALPPGT